MIELKDVALSVGGNGLLSRINARIAGGQFVALLGPNGSGKTTLLRAIAGLHPLDAGEILLDGRRPNARVAAVDRARHVALVTGDEVLLDALAVVDIVAIGRFPHHRWWQWRTSTNDTRAISDALNAVKMAPFRDRLFSTLSAGERQRVWVALGIAQETPILLLDEPTSHLDVHVAHDILALLRRLAQNGKTVLCALHDINEAAAYAEAIGLLADGTLVTPAPPDAVLSGPLLDRTYGIAMERLRLADGRIRIFPMDEKSAGDEHRNRAPIA